MLTFFDNITQRPTCAIFEADTYGSMQRHGTCPSRSMRAPVPDQASVMVKPKAEGEQLGVEEFSTMEAGKLADV